jgi:hypothetical protein
MPGNTFLFASGPVCVFKERPPVNKLRYVLDQKAFNIKLGQPSVNGPGIHPGLIMDRLTAAGSRIKLAFRRGHKQIKISLRNDFIWVGYGHIFNVVPGFRMVLFMGSQWLQASG